ncbi:hypothetical protein ACX80Z_15705 [Arthrobacter sp. TMT4-20]
MAGLIMVSAVIFYAAGLALRGSAEFDFWVDGVIALLCVWLPTGVAWMAVLRTRLRRYDILCAAAGVTSLAIADTYYVVKTGEGQDVPLGSPADIFYLLSYVLILASLIFVVVWRFRAVAWPVVLDSTVGTLGAGAVLVVVLDPFLNVNAGRK